MESSPLLQPVIGGPVNTVGVSPHHIPKLPVIRLSEYHWAPYKGENSFSPNYDLSWHLDPNTIPLIPKDHVLILSLHGIWKPDKVPSESYFPFSIFLLTHIVLLALFPTKISPSSPTLKKKKKKCPHVYSCMQTTKMRDFIPYIISILSCPKSVKYCQTYIASILNALGDSKWCVTIFLMSKTW